MQQTEQPTKKKLSNKQLLMGGVAAALATGAVALFTVDMSKKDVKSVAGDNNTTTNSTVEIQGAVTSGQDTVIGGK